ncbi:MAG: 4Fe-4S cluster-binding domain-containing protein, partial [Muribaculaceae bacterium]|nr:4Fe-4S cluster-binding domain-containing protein [Muribaculaceae bacterium]
MLDIIPGTSVDGPGLRTSIYFAGCAHRCPGCHNPQSWDFTAGNEMSINEIVEEVDRHGFNVTFSGGDPLYQLPALIPLAKALREKGYTIWCYTGFRYE